MRICSSEKNFSVVFQKKKKSYYQTKTRLTLECRTEFAPSLTRLTGGLAVIGIRELGFFILDYRPVLLIARGQTLVWLFDKFGRIFHLDPRFRLLDQRLRLRLTLLIARLLTAGFDMTGVLFLVQRHRRVPDERVAAVRSGTVEVPINAIAVATA